MNHLRGERQEKEKDTYYAYIHYFRLFTECVSIFLFCFFLSIEYIVIVNMVVICMLLPVDNNHIYHEKWKILYMIKSINDFILIIIILIIIFSHIRHDLEGQINKSPEDMTAEEQNFYYFRLHDTNNDNRLDGLEVIAAMDHVHDESFTDEQDNNQTDRMPDDELINLVDDILKEEDLDRDGFISYEEFKHALEKDKMA